MRTDAIVILAVALALGCGSKKKSSADEQADKTQEAPSAPDYDRAKALDEAEALARKDDDDGARALAHVARARLAAGQRDRALALSDEVVKMASALDEKSHAEATLMAGATLYDAGAEDRGRAAAQRAVDVLAAESFPESKLSDTLDVPMAPELLRSLLDSLRDHEQVGYGGIARGLFLRRAAIPIDDPRFAEFVEAAAELDPIDHAGELVALGRILAAHGRDKEALALATRAAELVGERAAEEDVVVIAVGVAQLLADVGRPDDAARLLDAADRYRREAGDDDYELLAAIAAARARAGGEAGDQAIAAARDALASEEPDSWSYDAWVDVAYAIAVREDTGAAIAYLRGTMPDDLEAETLDVLSSMLGDDRRWDDALAVAEAISEPDEQVSSKTWLIERLIAVGELDRAETIASSLTGEGASTASVAVGRAHALAGEVDAAERWFARVGGRGTLLEDVMAMVRPTLLARGLAERGRCSEAYGLALALPGDEPGMRAEAIAEVASRCE